MTTTLPLLAILAATSFAAGFIDSLVGGGGLINIPMLFTALPKEIPATLFGTNKFASFFGTSSAAWRYARRVDMPWGATLVATAGAFACSYLGAMAVAWLPRELLRPLILVLLVASAVYTFRRKDFGVTHAPRPMGPREYAYALALGGVIGFYDGFFGPGTGSFLIFLFIRVFGFDFLHASASAKIVNLATNLAAIAYFIPNRFFLVDAAITMALFNIAGAVVGTQLAFRRGSGFVRQVFLVMVCVLIVKFALDTF
ncbi:MAG: TSUP family transporter [Candidatus Accumulibacter sp.]|jgi:uncharacterized membrane protein YfcA|nr:TSUP family transporter [Accumulibacter sp.]